MSESGEEERRIMSETNKEINKLKKELEKLKERVDELEYIISGGVMEVTTAW